MRLIARVVPTGSVFLSCGSVRAGTGTERLIAPVDCRLRMGTGVREFSTTAGSSRRYASADLIDLSNLTNVPRRPFDQFFADLRLPLLVTGPVDRVQGCHSWINAA